MIFNEIAPRKPQITTVNGMIMPCPLFLFIDAFASFAAVGIPPMSVTVLKVGHIRTPAPTNQRNGQVEKDDRRFKYANKWQREKVCSQPTFFSFVHLHLTQFLGDSHDFSPLSQLSFLFN